MKKSFLMMLVATSVCCNDTKAQKVLLQSGQTSQQQWTGVGIQLPIDGGVIPEGWYKTNFQEKEWNTIHGPLSTNNKWPNYQSPWGDNNTTYLVRRHFNIESLNNINVLEFYCVHDDGCEAYLNDSLIYSSSAVVSNYAKTNIYNVRNLLKTSDNVLAVKVSDTNGGEAYIDFGLIGNSLTNSFFDYNDGWKGSYDRTSYDNNTQAYKYGKNWTCEQSFTNMAEGLYKLSANACGLNYYNDNNEAIAHKDNPLDQKLFIGKDEVSIPSVFSEIAETDIYNGSYRWEYNGGYVPYSHYRVPAALKRNMYQTEVWSYYVPEESESLTVGIHCYPNSDIDRWAAWDNMSLSYYTEEEVNVLLNSIVDDLTDLVSRPMSKSYKEMIQKYLEQKSSMDYATKSRIYAFTKNNVFAENIIAYEKLYQSYQMLADSISNLDNFVSPATIEEANNFNAEILTAHETGAYTNEEVETAIQKMNKLMERLSYTYLDISINAPGSLGDSILKYVENFVDVKSIKLSGTLNADDITTIQTRLTSLREIDLTDVNMHELPDRLLYKHSELEQIKLPKNLVTIGEYAFSQCNVLKFIDFPSTLNTIKQYAFENCNSLKEVILPEKLSSLEGYAFYNCSNIKKVKLPVSLTSINSYTFANNYNLTDIEFVEGLTRIEKYAFSNCHSIKTIKFPTTLSYIGNNAFSTNKALTEVQFNEGLYQIGDNAFYHCDALKEITLPSSLVLANISPFDYCDNLVKVTCLSIEPPYMTDQIPYGCDMAGRELYVPALSINTYKQTTGWDKFPTIKPIDHLPENFTVLSNLKLTLPETIPADYKPNVALIHDKKGSNYFEYGSLTVNGAGTLSMNNFSLIWDPNWNYNNDNRNQNFCSLVNNSHLRADSVSIQLFTPNDRWTFVTFPFDVKVSEIQTTEEGTTNWVIRKYDGAKRAAGEVNETWIRLNGDDILNAGEGYIIQGSRYIENSWKDFSGFKVKAINNANKNNIFTSNNIDVTLNEYQSEFAHNRGWNLIGNPYPCYYDTRYMDFTAPITVWNIKNNTYVAYSPVDDSYILCPGEAFFVQCPVDKKVINFDKNGRQTNRTARTLDAQTMAKANNLNETKRIVVNLTLSDDKNTDYTRIVFNDQSSMDYEMDKDANKFISPDASVPQLYSYHNNVNYAINERPLSEGVVTLYAKTPSKAIYTIALQKEIDGYKIVLEDKALNKRVVLDSETAYMFNASSVENPNRFVLYLQRETTSIDSVNEDEEKENTKEIYTISGMKVSEPLSKGIYIQNGKKIVIK